MVYYDYTNAIFMGLAFLTILSCIKAFAWKVKYTNLKERNRKL